MSHSYIASLLSTDGYIVTNKVLIKLFGLNTAVLIGELCAEYQYWQSNYKLDDGYFYSTQANIEENTGLSAAQQKSIIDNLEEKNIIWTTKKGMPAKKYYAINFEELDKLLSQFTENQETCIEKIEKHGSKKPRINNNKTNNNNENNSISKDIEPEVSEYESHMYSKDDFLGSCKDKPKSNSLFNKCLTEIYVYTGNEAVREKLIEYLKFRINVKDKPLYNVNLWKSILKKLYSVVDESPGVDILDVIQQSIDKSWLSFYPLKSFSNKRDVFAEGSGLSCEQDDTTEEERAEILEKQGRRSSF